MGLNKLNHNYDYSFNIKTGAIENLSSITDNSRGTSVMAGTANISNLQQISEIVNDVTISSNRLTLNVSNGNLFHLTAAPSANFTINVTNLPTTNLKSTTISIFVTQGTTGYRPSAFEIEGVSYTIRWLGGTVPTPTSSFGKIDIFNFSMLRRSNSWFVLANSNLNF